MGKTPERGMQTFSTAVLMARPWRRALLRCGGRRVPSERSLRNAIQELPNELLTRFLWLMIGTYRAMTATSTSDGNGHGGSSGLRYRRKVPASGKADAKAAVGEDNQRESAAATGGKRHEDGEDNQREHEQAAAVAPLAHGDVGAGNQACDAKKQKKKHKPRATSDDKAQSPDRDVSGKKDAQRKPKRGGQGDKSTCSVSFIVADGV